MTENKTKLTIPFIKALEPKDIDYIVWDADIKGFAVKVTPKGKKVYFLYYRTKSGKQRRPIIGDFDAIKLKKARDIAEGWWSEIKAGGDPSGKFYKDKTSPTVYDLYELYQSKHLHNLKPRSAVESTRMWNKDILPKIGDLKLSQIDKNDILKLHSSFKDTPYKANRVLELLSSAFNLAESWGMHEVHANPCRTIKKFSETKRERFLSLEEIKNLADTLSDLEAKDIENKSAINALRLLMYTGCRLNEILTLKWKYIDFDNGALKLPDSKTGAKTVYLAPYALQLLKTIDGVKDNPYVITGKNEKARLVNISKAWRRIRKKAGLDTLRIHDLRHTFASIGAASGLSLPIIGALLGHKDSQTTQRYAHLIGEPLQQAASLIGGKITEAIKTGGK
jgi:integrase